jgi:hypothetical protein
MRSGDTLARHNLHGKCPAGRSSRVFLLRRPAK